MRVDKYTMARMNKRMVLESIRESGSINKAEIARQTDLSIPTVMKITDDLVGTGLVRSRGKQESVSGKRPEMFEFAQDAFYSVGVDVGPTKLIAVVMDFGGHILARRQAPTGALIPAKGVVQRIAGLIHQVVEESGVPSERLLGVGLGVPGILDTEAGRVLFSPNFHWENVEIARPLEQLMGGGLYIKMENSNRALALGEQFFGAGAGHEYFICVNLGYGIGSAVIENGAFYTGSSGTSGEVGHITVEKDGPLCTCGNSGCLEAVASGRAIAQQAKNLISGGVPTSILDLAGGNIEEIEAKTVFEAARRGDPAARELVRKAGEYIGIGLANYINLLDPEKIILAGGMSGEEILTGEIQRVVKVRQMRFAGRKVKIRPSALGGNATSIGAATLILRRVIELGGSTALNKEASS